MSNLREDNHRPPIWVPMMVFSLAMIASSSLALLIWLIVNVIPVLRAAGGLS